MNPGRRLIEDNGTGFDRGQIKEGLGLFTIENRVRLLGGQVEFKQVASGSKISINVVN